MADMQIGAILRRSPIASQGVVDLVYHEQAAQPRQNRRQLQRQRDYFHQVLDSIDLLRNLLEWSAEGLALTQPTGLSGGAFVESKTFGTKRSTG